MESTDLNNKHHRHDQQPQTPTPTTLNHGGVATKSDDDPHPPPSPNKAPMNPPQNQEMERSPSNYRIPPSVFERNKSSSPADWSTASNESLFSIHMGNMSFTKDSLWKSGDLGPPADAAPRPSTSDMMFNYAGQTPGGGGAAADMRSRELGIAEATMLEVIKENEGRRSPTSSISEVRNPHRSPGSNQSNMSFAFSVAGRDTERMQSSVKSSMPAAEEQPDAEEAPAAAEKEKGPQTQSKWSMCFPCCSSFCS